jgi:hypothetical protein
MVYFTLLQTLLKCTVHSVIEGGSHSTEHESWILTELSVFCVEAREWEKLDLPAYVLIRVHWHKLQKVETVVLKLVVAGAQNPLH